MRRAAFVCLLLTLACASTPALPGTWRSIAGAPSTVLDFHRDGTLSWTYPGGVVQARYAVRGKELDITDFSGGMLQGKALYCIFELESERRLRMDCESARPGQTDVRPKVFDPAQTQIYER